MNLEKHILLLLSYALMLAPGCKTASDTELKGKSIEKRIEVVEVGKVNKEIDNRGMGSLRDKMAGILENLGTDQEIYITGNTGTKRATNADLRTLVGMKGVALEGDQKSQIFIVRDKGDSFGVSIQSKFKDGRFDLITKSHDFTKTSRDYKGLSDFIQSDFGASIVNFEVTSLNLNAENAEQIKVNILAENRELLKFSNSVKSKRPSIWKLFLATAVFVFAGFTIIATTFIIAMASDGLVMSQRTKSLLNVFNRSKVLFFAIAIGTFIWMCAEIIIKATSRDPAPLPSKLLEGV